MGITVREVTSPAEKERAAREVLEDLRAWFEVDEAREGYIRGSRDMAFLAAGDGPSPGGFLCLRPTGDATAEIAVMGVRREAQRRGTGLALVRAAEAWAAGHGFEFLQVKTVRMGCYEDYDGTNRFYRAAGFREMEVIPAVWGEANPCQIYIKPVDTGRRVLGQILSRRSYRGTYLPVPVPREDLRAILEAGLAAPSGCNRQTVSLIAVDDSETLRKIREVIDPPVAATAPAMVFVLSERIIAYRDRCFATQDYAAAIENMLLACEALGYASCWYEGHITDTDRIGDRIARILGVPESRELVCLLPVGIPEGQAKAPQKQPFGARAWFGRFGGEEE